MEYLIFDLILVLAAGLAAGTICKRWDVSLLAGYLIVGSLIGPGGFGFIDNQQHELQQLAEAGALFLLFAVGLEFAPSDLVKLKRPFLIGGPLQMGLVALPLILLLKWAGLSWPASILIGASCSLSSTVLVFRALSELGQTATPHGRSAIGILLFQDVAIVILLLMVPLLTGQGNTPTIQDYAFLAGKSLCFVGGVIVLQRLCERTMVPMLSVLRSIELLVLFTLVLLGGICWIAHAIGLPTPVGALATGLALSGNRLSKQIDAIVIPFREAFAAVFFVTLGMLLKPIALLSEPLLLLSGFVAMIVIKTLATMVVMRCLGLKWKSAFGISLGLAQLGEFSFLLVLQGAQAGILQAEEYNRVLLIGMGTLIATPFLLKFGLHQMVPSESGARSAADRIFEVSGGIQRAIVIGIGPIGRQVSSRLELRGIAVTLIDLSPINLQPFVQMGFQTFAGDARDPEVLRAVHVENARMVVVCLASDDTAIEVVKKIRKVSKTVAIVVRCRFESTAGKLKMGGANHVVSEEQEASGPLLEKCDRVLAT